MTRINLVNVEDLADQHLFAEWREIKMIPVKVRALKENRSAIDFSVHMHSVPATYTMSTGHVKFFYNKMSFLFNRFVDLTHELRQREYNISETDPEAIFLNGFPTFVLQDWEPTRSEVEINVNRIKERLFQRPTWYRHYGAKQPPDYFIEKYNRQLLFMKLKESA